MTKVFYNHPDAIIPSFHGAWDLRLKNNILSLQKFDDNIFLNDVQNIPFWVCDVFEDEDDRLLSFGKLFSDVIDKNAPIKKRTYKKTFPTFDE